MKDATLIFLHGLEGNNKGYKAVTLGRLFPDILLPQFTGEFDERMVELREILADREDVTIIGSSLGGLMAAVYALEEPQKITKLILLAPALPMREWRDDQSLAAPVITIHGVGDDIVPMEPTREVAEKLFTNLDFREVDDDHRLKKTTSELDWQTLVS